MKLEEGGALLPHCYLDEEELRELLSGFDIRRLGLDVEPERPGASRYYTVIAASHSGDSSKRISSESDP